MTGQLDPAPRSPRLSTPTRIRTLALAAGLAAACSAGPPPASFARPRTPPWAESLEVNLASVDRGAGPECLGEGVGFIAATGRPVILLWPGTLLPVTYTERFHVDSDDGIAFDFVARARGGVLRELATLRSSALQRGPGEGAVPFIILTVEIAADGAVTAREFFPERAVQLGRVGVEQPCAENEPL